MALNHGNRPTAWGFTPRPQFVVLIITPVCSPSHLGKSFFEQTFKFLIQVPSPRLENSIFASACRTS